MDDKFLAGVTQLFLENGVKTVTMDDIARHFGISKKTLYTKYRNKDALIEDALLYKLEEIAENLKRLNVEVENAIERMLCRDEQIEKATRSNDSLMIRQLMKYYPEIFNKHMQAFSVKFSEVFIHNVHRGREQGLFRENFDEALYVKFVLMLMLGYNNSPIIDTENTDRELFEDTVMDFYMNAIVTEKGRQEYYRLKKENIK
ncbi:MAG: TetR/AcrR family transcriptional regulator [Cruoricaptor ignavus]|nr:TetR/AcrR family transcriptional regulator [Cruoricaptor ignavus]